MNGDDKVLIFRDLSYPQVGFAVAWFYESFPKGPELNNFREQVLRAFENGLTMDQLIEKFVREMEAIIAEIKDEVLQKTYRGIAEEMRHPEFRTFLGGVLGLV